MNNQLSIIIFWMLALSCKAPVSSLDQSRATLVSAEKSEWFGGRPGVRGMLYTAVLKSKNSKDHIIVKTFRAEGNTIRFRQTGSGNTVSVKGNFQKSDETHNFTYPSSGPPAEKPVDLNPKDNWIEYSVNNSEKKYRIIIPEFTSVEPEGELIPPTTIIFFLRTKLFFLFLLVPFVIVLMNMIYPAVACMKSSIYEITLDHISKHETDPSETVYFSEKEMAGAEWKEEKEFTLNGYSYDIIKVDLKNGRKYYRCYVDKKDLVLNSILTFSGFFVTKKVYAWRHFNLPLHHTKLIKASGFFIFSDAAQPQPFHFYIKPESDYFKRLKNACDLSVIIPPPEERFIA